MTSSCTFTPKSRDAEYPLTEDQIRDEEGIYEAQGIEPKLVTLKWCGEYTTLVCHDEVAPQPMVRWSKSNRYRHVSGKMTMEVCS